MAEFFNPVEIVFVAKATEAIASMKELGAEAGRLESRFAKMTMSQRFEQSAKIVGRASGIMVTALAGIATGAIIANDKVEVANAQLENSYRNLGVSAEKAMPIAKALETNFTNLGFMTTSTAGALGILTTGLHSATAGMNYMGVAADFARKTGMTLEESASAIVKASVGQTRAFKAIGVAVDTTLPPQERFIKLMKDVQAVTNGAAKTFTTTGAGAMDVMKAKTQDAAASLGQALIPLELSLATLITNTVAPAIKNLTKFYNDHKKEIALVTGVLALLWLNSKIYAGMNLMLNGLKAMKAAWILLTAAEVEAGAAAAATEAVLTMGVSLLIAGGAATVAYLAFKKLTKAKVDDTAATKDQSGALLDFNSIMKAMNAQVGGKGLSIADPKGVAAAAAAATKAANDLKTAAQGLMVTFGDMAKQINTMNEGFHLSAEFMNASQLAVVDYTAALKDYVYQSKLLAADAKNFSKDTGASAIEQAKNVQTSLNAMQKAITDYSNTVSQSIQSMRSSFQSATAVDLGSMFGNIESAKQKLADAQTALAKSQAQFTKNTAVAAYKGVAVTGQTPIDTAAQDAVNAAQKDLDILLGKQKATYLTTAQDMQDALTAAYQRGNELASVAGRLQATGFSQDFVMGIVNAGPVIGVAMGNQILAANIPAQKAMNATFSALTDLSAHGLDQVATNFNAGAIAAMDAMINGFKSKLGELQAVMNAIAALAGTTAPVLNVTPLKTVVTPPVVTPPSTNKTLVPGTGQYLGSMFIPPQYTDGTSGTTPSAAIASAASAAKSVTIKAGDTLSKIATANSTTVAAILKANPVFTTNPKYNDGNTIFAGGTVKIPSITVNVAQTGASAADIAAAMAFAAKTNSDATLALAPSSAVQTGVTNKIAANKGMLAE